MVEQFFVMIMPDHLSSIMLPRQMVEQFVMTMPDSVELFKNVAKSDGGAVCNRPTTLKSTLYIRSVNSGLSG